MRRTLVRLALAMALGSGTASCYFLSNFDDLGGAAATTSGGSSGSGGSSAPASATQSSGAAGTGAAGSSGGSGGAGSSGATGTGGTTCPPPGASYAGLVMNELAPKGIPDDWIELRNNGPVAVPLCGVMLAQHYDDITVPAGPDRFTFGAVYLAPGKYLVVAAVSELPFGLAKDAPERITLFSPDGKVLDDTSWDVSPATAFTSLESWARIPDGTGLFKRVENPTKGTSNFELGGTGGAGGAGDAGDGG
jgi:hypothetical protein